MWWDALKPIKIFCDSKIQLDDPLSSLIFKKSIWCNGINVTLVYFYESTSKQTAGKQIDRRFIDLAVVSYVCLPWLFKIFAPVEANLNSTSSSTTVNQTTILFCDLPLMARCTQYKVCQWLATDRWFSPGTLVSFTNKMDLHDIAKILLKVSLKTTTLTLTTQR
jgi:hypothetical protein